MRPYWPVEMQYPIFQKFGEHPEIYTKRHGHPGLDFATPMRSELFAICDGVITAAAYREAGGYGREVFIKAGKYTIIYGHLSRIDVRVGDTVKRGQVIGLSGGDPNDGDKLDGFSSGPHLHFEVRDTSLPYNQFTIGAVDPEIWLAADVTLQPVSNVLTGSNVTTGENTQVVGDGGLEINPVAPGGHCVTTSRCWLRDNSLVDEDSKVLLLPAGTKLPVGTTITAGGREWNVMTLYVAKENLK
ncbi:hypothetical protein CCP3SC15_3860002 [Gammaproteobacteria bacterium]